MVLVWAWDITRVVHISLRRKAVYGKIAFVAALSLIPLGIF